MTNPQTKNAQNILIDRLLILIVVLTSIYSVSNNVADPDLWGHTQYGNDVLRDGYIHPTTTYSYTAEGYRWINHENLSELTLAVVWNMGGIWGLMLLKISVALLVFGLILRYALREGASLMAAATITILVSINLSFYFSFRPQLLSFTYFVLMVSLLNYCFAGWRDHFNLRLDFFRKKSNDASDENAQADQPVADQPSYDIKRLKLLWIMPVILCLWTNSHGGFVAGVCIYLAYLGLRTLEVFMVKGKQSFGLIRRFALMGFVGVLATFLNPYGFGLQQWLLNSLGEPRPEILEWVATDPFGASGVRLLSMVLVAGLALAFTKKSRDLTHLIILSITLWQSFEHVRHVPFFAILCGFWIPPHLASAFSRFKNQYKVETEEPAPEQPPSFIKWAYGLASVGILVALVIRFSDIPVKKKDYPVSAFQYMADHELNGNLVVTYNWAQYAIAAFGTPDSDLPHCPVAFDGRFRTCYPQEVVDMHFDFVMGDKGPEFRNRTGSLPFDESAVLRHMNPELVLISRRQKPSVEVMNRNLAEWSLLYQDQIAEVWGLKSKFGDPQSPSFVPESSRIYGDTPQTGSQTWPALPKSSKWKRLPLTTVNYTK